MHARSAADPVGNLIYNLLLRLLGKPPLRRETHSATAFKFLAFGNVNCGFSAATAKPKSSIALWPMGSTVSGLSSRFAAAPVTFPTNLCQRPFPASLRFTDPTVTSIFGGPGAR